MMKFTAVVLLLSTTLAHAWGPQGHKLVAQIAEKSLTPKALAEVQMLLKGESMADVSTWADEVKQGGEYAHTKSWHFVEIPDGQDYASAEHNHDGDVVVATKEMVRTLKDSRASVAQKIDALKFLIHFVGDIHQPLHVSRPGDRGGNETMVIVQGRKTNLHAIWDTYLVPQVLNTTQVNANALSRMISSASYDIPEFSFSLVIAEDLAARPSVYALGGTNTITDAYIQKQQKLMATQLFNGGKRLAGILNQIFR